MQDSALISYAHHNLSYRRHSLLLDKLAMPLQFSGDVEVLVQSAAAEETFVRWLELNADFPGLTGLTVRSVTAVDTPVDPAPAPSLPLTDGNSTLTPETGNGRLHSHGHGRGVPCLQRSMCFVPAIHRFMCCIPIHNTCLWTYLPLACVGLTAPSPALRPPPSSGSDSPSETPAPSPATLAPQRAPYKWP